MTPNVIDFNLGTEISTEEFVVDTRRANKKIVANYTGRFMDAEPKPRKYTYILDDVFDDFEHNEPKEKYHVPGRDTKQYESHKYCIENHIKSIAEAKNQLYGRPRSFNYRVMFKEDPAPTLVQGTEHLHGYQMRSISIDEAKRIQTFPEDYIVTGGFQKQWERIGRSVPPRVYEKFGLQIKKCLDDYNEEQRQ